MKRAILLAAALSVALVGNADAAKTGKKGDGLKRVWDKAGNAKIKRVYDKQGNLVYEQAWDITTGKPIPTPRIAAPAVEKVASSPSDDIDRIEEQNRFLRDKLMAMEEAMESMKMDLEHQKMAQESVKVEAAPAKDSCGGCDSASKGPKFKFSGELRSRYETKQYEKKNGAKYDSNKEFVGQRSRLTVDAKVNDRSSAVMRFQDRRIWGSNGTDLTDNGDNTELNLIYYDYKDIINDTNLRVGRQELGYADERVIGPVGWSNQGRTFDAVKISHDSHGGKHMWDFFASKVKEDNNEASNDVDFGGIYARFHDRKDLKWDAYVLMKRDGANDQDLTHLGLNLKGGKNRFNWELQGGSQMGEYGKNDISAAAGHGLLGYTFTGKNKPKVEVEYNYASGDDNPTAGDVKTYDELYPTNHGKYGIVDIVDYKNLEEFVAAVGFKPCDKSQFKLSWHQFQLAEKNDNLYFSNTAFYTPAGTLGAFGKNIGTEIDVEYSYNYSKNLSFGLAFGAFEADNAVEKLYPTLDGTTFFELGATYKF